MTSFQRTSISSHWRLVISVSVFVEIGRQESWSGRMMYGQLGGGLYSTLHITLHCTVIHCTVLHRTVINCTVLQCTALHRTVIHCNKPLCTALHCTVYSRPVATIMEISMITAGRGRKKAVCLDLN